MPSLAEMQQAAVYDLSVAPPHVPDDAHFTAAEFAIYRAGYTHALVMSLTVMQHAVSRFALRVRTRKLEARRKRLV